MLFLTNVFNDLKPCPTLLQTVGLPVPSRNLRGFRLDNVDLKPRNCPSATSASAVNAIGSDTDIFNGSSISINDLLVFGAFTR